MERFKRLNPTDRARKYGPLIVETPVKVGVNEIKQQKVKTMAEESKGRRPDYRIVQADQDKDGKAQFKNVGAIWMNEGGKSAGVVKIGDLRLVLFKNEERK